jgi:signal transduction histidine kinase
MTEIRIPTDKAYAKVRLITSFLCLLALLVIGCVDYIIGYRVSLLVFYAIPIGVAATYVGSGVAILLAIFAVAVSRGGDLLSGMPYPGHSVFFWNCAIPFAFFIIFILVLRLLQLVRQSLEKTVEDRNRALLQEMHERGRLERQVIELSEREHRRFGQELHDLVSQELAAIALDTHLLTRNLLAAGHDESERAREVAIKVDRALTRARNIARGYFTLGFDAASLDEALREIARRAETPGRLACAVKCTDNLSIGNEDATVQLFRIAQEAVQNAARHAAASQITIGFERQGDNFLLTVQDNGKGLPKGVGKHSGLGLSIMAYRAALIGGTFAIESPATGGTRIVCRIPAVKLTRKDTPVAAA